ncbi:Scarecrow-like transcription factor pat1 [Thalictrum thalictroides]|uniref:Scarecrow-like transcription factor pat1 n=1 Tax=Thalictrum thalictroides TaxID=46969 RepID=A0A7J6VWJ2_THATH|nr:Scarecrow-like transcription factor pat1 [Thalictrum thalictroides]
MSLISSTDLSATSYGEPKLYKLKKGNENSGFSTQILSSDKRKFKYGPDSNCRESYNQQCFSDSSTEDFPSSRMEFISPSISGSPGTIFRPRGSASDQLIAGSDSISSGNSYSSFVSTRHHNGFRPDSATGYFDRLSPDHEIIDFDEDDIRLKLQELERELLNDNDDDVFIVDQNMDIDCEWADSIKNLVLPNSPKESSSESELSSISSNKDTLILQPVSSPHTSQNLTPKQMLFECAALISEGNMEESSNIINKLRQMVSIQGDPPMRLAAYMVEGLAARIATSGKGLYTALKCKEPPTTDRLSAMQILFEICPCFKFGFMAANGAIAEAFKDEVGVHIVDFDINQGSQYITLIQALASRTGKPPHIRITGVDDPETVQRTVGGLKVIGQRLEKLAEGYKVPFEFCALAVKTENVTPSMLECRPNEVLVVNFAFQLHHMPDESVSTVNQRDQLLRMVKSLKPKLVTVVEQDVNTNTAPFLPRFVEAYNYYSAVFESLDATLPRGSPDRMNVERQCLARDIVNIVACEGEDRIERYEVAGKWRARMTMAGFKPYPLSTYVNGTIRTLLKQYCDRYKVKEEGGALHFGWEDKILIVASAWK